MFPGAQDRPLWPEGTSELSGIHFWAEIGHLPSAA